MRFPPSWMKLIFGLPPNHHFASQQVLRQLGLSFRRTSMEAVARLHLPRAARSALKLLSVVDAHQRIGTAAQADFLGVFQHVQAITGFNAVD